MKDRTRQTKKAGKLTVSERWGVRLRPVVVDLKPRLGVWILLGRKGVG